MTSTTPASDAATVPGKVMLDEVIPARGSWSGIVTRGQVLRLIDLEGQQAIDFLCFNANDPQERYHAPNTIKIPRNIFLGEGSILRSSLANPMMTITKDTCGNHDTIFGCCSFEVDDVRYGKHNAKCCQQNFENELARHGLGKEHVVPNANFFMFVPVADRSEVETRDYDTGASRPAELHHNNVRSGIIRVLHHADRGRQLIPGVDELTQGLRQILFRQSCDEPARRLRIEEKLPSIT